MEWVFHMAEIGYGQTRRQLCEMVKKFLDKDGRPNPFKDNRPGRDSWYGFVGHYSKLSLTYWSYHASACTTEMVCGIFKMKNWFS